MAQRDEFDNVFHSIRDGVITYDTDFRIHFTNRSLLKMLHLPKDEAARPYEGLPAGSIFKIYNNGKELSLIHISTPLGFDTEHVYRVKLASIPPGGKEYKPGDTDSLKIEQWFSILSRLRAYPGVEAVSLSIGSHPYNQNSSSGSRGIDTTWVHGYVYNVSPDYFRVFRITAKQGKTESLLQAATQENTGIISAETEREFSAKGTDALGKGAVSYTHLDVYKRQILNLLSAWWPTWRSLHKDIIDSLNEKK